MTPQTEYLEFTIKCMKVIKLWPKSESEMSSGIFTLKQIILIIIPAILLLASSLTDFYRQVGLGMMDDITNVTDNILVSGCLVTMVHLIVCSTVQRKNLLQLFAMLKEFNKFGVPPNQDATEQRTALITKILLCYGAFACVMYFFLPFFYLEDCEQRRLTATYDKDLPCGLFSRIWLPFRFDYTPVFELAALFLMYPSVWFAYVLLSFTALQFGFVTHISAHIINFKRLLYNAVRGDKPLDSMKKCVQYHNDIIRFCDHLNVCFSQMAFIHIYLTSVTMSVIAFELLQMVSPFESFRLFCHLMGWVLVLFVACSSGQQLIDESSSICHAAYDTDWPDANVRVQKYILLIILRAQKPLVVSTGAFGVLSLEKFLSVTSTSYTYFTLLASSQ